MKCYVLSDSRIQTLPIESSGLGGCASYVTLTPQYFRLKAGGLLFWVGAKPPEATASCVMELVDAILGAADKPGNMSFEEKCAFCRHHGWACTNEQIILCKLDAQAHNAGSLFRGQGLTIVINVVVYAIVSGGTIAYALRPLTRLIHASEFVPWARLIETYQLMVVALYWVLVTIATAYAASVGQIA